MPQPENPVVTPPVVTETPPAGDAGSTPVVPTTVKIGDRELTSEQVEAALKVAEEVEKFSKEHGDFHSLKSEFTKAKQELAELKKAPTAAPSDSVKDVLDGSKPIESLSPNEKVEYEYFKSLGFVDKHGIEKLLATQSEKIEELSKKLSETSSKVSDKEKAELKQTIEAQMDTLVEKYPFYKKEEAWDYLNKEAAKGNHRTPEQAVRDLYFEQAVAAEAAKRGGIVPESTPSVPADKTEHQSPQQTGSPIGVTKSFRDELEAAINASSGAE